ncbi:MAG: hypothetical protein KKA42_00745 [candidate division Zixibacteria bacterium]|nr:hypothetical protein [candidate division Zixibacteria bacterium]
MTAPNTRFHLLAVCLTAIALFAACDHPPSDFPSLIQGTWQTSDAAGQVERVCIDGHDITYACGTENAYSCAYQCAWFDEEKRTMMIMTPCEKRAGASDPVHYVVSFQDDNAFQLLLKDRVVGVFERATAGGEAGQ